MDRHAERQTWLANLKAGDQVAIENRTENPRVATVDHTTATQILIGSMKFRRKDGYRMGHNSGFYVPRLEIPTEERLNAVEHTELRRWLHRLCDDDGRGYSAIPLSVLRKLKQAYDEVIVEQPTEAAAS